MGKPGLREDRERPADQPMEEVELEGLTSWELWLVVDVYHPRITL